MRLRGSLRSWFISIRPATPALIIKSRLGFYERKPRSDLPVCRSDPKSATGQAEWMTVYNEMNGHLDSLPADALKKSLIAKQSRAKSHGNYGLTVAVIFSSPTWRSAMSNTQANFRIFQMSVALPSRFTTSEIYRQKIVEQLAENPANVWLTDREICDGFSFNGDPIDPLVHELIKRSLVIEPRD